jgi:hypothetical protein
MKSEKSAKGEKGPGERTSGLPSNPSHPSHLSHPLFRLLPIGSRFIGCTAYDPGNGVCPMTDIAKESSAALPIVGVAVQVHNADDDNPVRENPE